MDLTADIESYLLDRPRWVPVAEICERFGINERALRGSGRRRPLHSFFAISSARPGAHGLKHIRHATTTERLAHKHRCRKTLIASARADKDYTLALAKALDRNHYDQTGHAVMPL